MAQLADRLNGTPLQSVILLRRFLKLVWPWNTIAW